MQSWAPLRMEKTQEKDLGHRKADWAIKTLPGAFLRLFGAPWLPELRLPRISQRMADDSERVA